MNYVLLGNKRYAVISVESYRVLDLDIPIQVDPKQGLLCTHSEVVLAKDLLQGITFESENAMIHHLAFTAQQEIDSQAMKTRMNVKIPGLEPLMGKPIR